MLIIPDVHGRTFWRETVESQPDEAVVFLGDYLDPYTFDGITFNQALDQLHDIVRLKACRGDKVVLLMGNHDLPYLFPGRFHCSRHNEQMEEPVGRLFKALDNQFQMTYSIRTERGVVIFSHAGLHPTWVLSHKDIFGVESMTDSGGIREWFKKLAGATPDASVPLDVARQCNELFHLEDSAFIKSLSEVSDYRGGDDFFGSMVWADVDEFKNADPWPGVFQVFGHSQQKKDPIIKEHYACLDCRQVFRLDEQTGELTQLTHYES